ncbi:glycosyltransferase [Phormidium sp. LEGE 05292]|uniref:glycosyltransferase n=1 Tax=[Phormidium] sp. LEGE 05292 TaxID=767427 RepID=UPI00187EA4BF|nr:glycosyltransferase [Phormidium sp. LEGE 05292]MBE9224082.1 glycosyltransferase [Phormidium sp. LEGE 05292]
MSEIFKIRPSFPYVTVVIPALNASSFIAVQLEALVQQEYPGGWEVIVVDNGSTDNTVEIAESFRYKLNIQIVSAVGTYCPAYARNTGAKIAKGELLCFCDADDRVCQKWILSMVCAAHHADAVGGRIDEVSLNDTKIQKWRTPLSRSGLPNAWYYLDYAPSGNFAIWKDKFDLLGGFDEEYYSCEDIEICWRLQINGGTLSYCNDAVVSYRHRNSLLGLARQNYIRARWAVLLVAKSKTNRESEPHLGSLMERVLYWDPICPNSFSIGRIVGIISMELGILAGIVIQTWNNIKIWAMTSKDSL